MSAENVVSDPPKIDAVALRAAKLVKARLESRNVARLPLDTPLAFEQHQASTATTTPD